MNGAIQITFGPGIDILFVTFLITGVAVFIGVLSNWIIAEIRDFHEALERRRAEREAEEQEILEDLEESFKESRDPENDAIFEEVARDYELKPATNPVQIVDAVSAHPTEYFVQYGENEKFSRTGVVDIVKTYEPYETAISMIKAHDKGFIRWRLVGDDNVVPDWHDIGFFAAPFAEGVYDHQLPKEKING
jgi:hypothetical protein